MSVVYPPLESLEPMPELAREVYSEQKFIRLKKDIAKRGVQSPLHGIKKGKKIFIFNGIHRLSALKAVNKQLIEKDENPFTHVLLPIYFQLFQRIKLYLTKDLRNNFLNIVNDSVFRLGCETCLYLSNGSGKKEQSLFW